MEEVKQGFYLPPILFNLYEQPVASETLEGSGDFRIGNQVLGAVKYADDLVVRTTEEPVFQIMIDRPVEIGRYDGIEINVGKINVIRISREPPQLQIMTDEKQVNNVEYFKCLGSMINDSRHTRDIETRITMEKAAFNRKKTLFTSKLDLNLRKKLVKCYIWSIALHGAETWTLRKIHQKYLESFEMWCWTRMEKISWTDRVRNGEVLRQVKDERDVLHAIKRKKATWIGHIWRRNSFKTHYWRKYRRRDRSEER